MRRLFPALVALAAFASPALALPPPPDEALAGWLKGRTEGKPVSCVSSRLVPSTSIIDDHTIVFRGGPVTYVNRLSQSCAGLRAGRALVTRVPSTRLCSGDIVTVIDPPTPGDYGSCSLDSFIPYRKH